MTTGERSAQIDRELNASLGVFDDRLREEQASIAGQRGGSGLGGDGLDGDGGVFGAAGASQGSGDRGSDDGVRDAENRGGSGNEGSSGGRGDAQGQGGGRQGGGGVGGGTGGGSGPNTVPAGIPDGSDDDIVARQLREAAMSESDPELREKLWQEYRNYKKGG
ncbi:hypothetical protein [Steroidobacter denitrificans]|nr:hypothetical protein [Steroidobacter denitrificans]